MTDTSQTRSMPERRPRDGSRAQLVRGRYVVRHWGPEAPAWIQHGAVLVEDGEVREVDAYEALHRRRPEAEVLGDGSHAVMPGFVNAHSHGRGVTTLRLGIPDEPSEIRAVALRRGLSVDPYADVLFGCVRQLEAGVTATMHLDSNYGGPPDGYQSRLESVIRAYLASGIRFAVGVGVRDHNLYGPYIGDAQFFQRLPPDAQAEVAAWPSPAMSASRYFELFDRLRDAFPGVELQFAPLSPDSCTDDLMLALRREATRRRVKLNVHLLESPYQKAHALARHGESGVAWLARTAFLGPDVICAHAVWLTEADIGLMRDSGAIVVHNPGSNLRLRSGLAPIRAMVERGVPIALGTDNLGINDEEDLLQECRLAQVLQSPPGLGLAPIAPATVLHWATAAGAGVIGRAGLGRLDPGAPADLILARLGRIARALDAGDDLAAAAVQWLRASDVDVVMVSGRVLVRNGRYVALDRDAVERAVWDTVRRYTPSPAVRTLKDAVTALYREWPPSNEPYYALHSRR
jgi:cytosine/adenosine deaminase-related metal-dependent hydrolase